MKKKIMYGGILVFCVAVIAVVISRQSNADKAQKENALGGSIGIVFQDETDGTQKEEASKIKSLLEEKGYEAQIVFSENSSETQQEQIEEMIEAKKSCLIIMPVDADSLEDSLKKAKKQGITVVAYDTMLTDTELVSYYVGYDYESAGESVGSYIVENKGLDTAKKSSPCTIEFFMGDSLEENQRLQMEGMLNILQPYLDKEVLQCKSLRTDYEDVSITKSSQEIAQQTCDRIMKANYMDEPVDIVCIGSEVLADAVITALKDQNGFEDDWPTIISLGAEKATYERIEDDTQALTVQEFRSNLPSLCADLVDKAIQGEKIKSLKEINNGAIDVPSSLGKVKLAYRDNYQQIMSEAGIE